MPRGRPRNQPPPDYVENDTDSDVGTDFDPTLVIEEIRPELKICSQHLSQNFFQMSVDLKKDLECVICMEKIDCKCCFTLLNCGHYFHGACLLQLQRKECPICKDSG